MKKKELSYTVKKPLSVRIKRQKYLLLMLLPGILWYVVFKYLPMLGLSLAFTDYGFKAKVSFIGLKNFKRLFSSTIFWNAFRNTLVISIMNIVFYFPEFRLNFLFILLIYLLCDMLNHFSSE